MRSLKKPSPPRWAASSESRRTGFAPCACQSPHQRSQSVHTLKFHRTFGTTLDHRHAFQTCAFLYMCKVPEKFLPNTFLSVLLEICFFAPFFFSNPEHAFIKNDPACILPTATITTFYLSLFCGFEMKYRRHFLSIFVRSCFLLVNSSSSFPVAFVSQCRFPLWPDASDARRCLSITCTHLTSLFCTL